MIENVHEKLIEEARAILSEDQILMGVLRESPVESVGSLMSDRVEPGVENLDGLSPLWAQFKREMHIFLCTDDPKYDTAREDLKSVEDSTRKYIVPGIAGVIGSVIGVGAAILTPFVALALITTMRVGTNAWCSVNSNKEPEFTQGDGQSMFLQEKP